MFWIDASEEYTVEKENVYEWFGINCDAFLNTGQFIAESIKSVLAQTYTNWKLIIVDDCSDDNADYVVETFLTDSRIRYIKNERNSGAAVSRNRALREAKGKWIAF